MYILGIDPGPKQSAFVYWDTDKNQILLKDKIDNDVMMSRIAGVYSDCVMQGYVVIEMIQSFGMPVGMETFETVFWIGRFYQLAVTTDGYEKVDRVLRKDIKMNMCGTTKAKDSNIRQALIDRFGSPGTKKNPGMMYGLHKDMIQAFAVAVTYFDIQKEKK
jgi:myo-inositol catabolism protein IolC